MSTEKPLVDIEKLTREITKSIADDYFKENHEKHLSDITGRVQYSVREALSRMGTEVTITILHRKEN